MRDNNVRASPGVWTGQEGGHVRDVEAVRSWPAVQSERIPGAEVAVMVHCGAGDDIDRTYGALGTAVAERAIGVDGPIREYYVVGFPHTDDEREHQTEVCWPVFRTAAA